jgi:alanine dehydrogenase
MELTPPTFNHTRNGPVGDYLLVSGPHAFYYKGVRRWDVRSRENLKTKQSPQGHPPAIRIFSTGLGADCTILEVDLEKMRFLDITLRTAHTLYSDESQLMELLPSVDLLIGAVLVPGAKAPRLIRREMLSRMRPGSVLVDIAIDQGGCAESSRPTTHQDPVYTDNGVLHYCVANMPGAYARTATQALTGATHRLIELLADLGLDEACRKEPSLLAGINVMKGLITCPAVGEAHDLPWRRPDVDIGSTPDNLPDSLHGR